MMKARSLRMLAQRKEREIEQNLRPAKIQDDKRGRRRNARWADGRFKSADGSRRNHEARRWCRVNRYPLYERE